jgi:hypothetical protein
MEKGHGLRVTKQPATEPSEALDWRMANVPELTRSPEIAFRESSCCYRSRFYHPIQVVRPLPHVPKRELWLLAIGTALIEAPLAAVAVLVILSHSDQFSLPARGLFSRLRPRLKSFRTLGPF